MIQEGNEGREWQIWKKGKGRDMGGTLACMRGGLGSRLEHGGQPDQTRLDPMGAAAKGGRGIVPGDWNPYFCMLRRGVHGRHALAAGRSSAGSRTHGGRIACRHANGACRGRHGNSCWPEAPARRCGPYGVANLFLQECQGGDNVCWRRDMRAGATTGASQCRTDNPAADSSPAGGMAAANELPPGANPV